MNHPKYPLFTDDPHLYLFISEGPRGRITKAVIYSQIGGNLFNLGFGDWNEELRKLDDSSRSNNGDRDKVLATVAFTALLMEINENFEIYGLLDGHTEPFQQGRNYEAFLIKRK